LAGANTVPTVALAMLDELDSLLGAGRSRRLPAVPERRRLRETAGLTQDELAHLLGVDRSSVSRWETGARTPRRGLATAYAVVLVRLAAFTSRYENGSGAAEPLAELAAEGTRDHGSR
jgi:DNA-binding XRE family transcriptional regulator